MEQKESVQRYSEHCKNRFSLSKEQIGKLKEYQQYLTLKKESEEKNG